MKVAICPHCGTRFIISEGKSKYVLELLIEKPMRFNELKRVVGLSSPGLAEILRALEEKKLIIRTQIAKQKVIYRGIVK